MKATEDLHQLIGSMSMSEKRHFKIHASRHVTGSGNNYIRLFDAIGRQERYDEPELKKKFDGETFIRHLPSEKHYLYGQVLESLNIFNREKTFLARYSNTIISIELLFNRGLFGHCKKLLRKAKKEAYALEKFSTLLMLIRWETLLFIKDEDDKNLNRSLNEEIRILEVIRNQTRLMQLAFNIQIRIDKGRVPPSYVREQEKALKEAFPARVEVSSFWTRYYYHSGIGLLSTIRNDQARRYKCFKEIKQLMDSAPQFIRELPGIYHLNSNNLVNVMFYLGKYDEAETLISQQRRFMPENGISHPNLAKLVFINTCESELFLYYKTKRFAAGAMVTKKIEGEIRKTDMRFSPMLYDLLFFMAVSELAVGNFKNAARWLNKILNAEEINLRKELLVNARLLFLVLLFESHDKLFDNRLQSVKRFLAREPQFAMQAKTAEVMRLLAEGDFTPKKTALLKKYAAEIRKANKQLAEKSLNKLFDFSEWVDRAIAVSLAG